jgi:hypothetical protein
MTILTRGLRIGMISVGMVALLSACQSSMNEEDRAMMQQAQADARAAQAAADRAADAADRAAAAAAEAADAASAAQMNAERQDRMMQSSLRK